MKRSFRFEKEKFQRLKQTQQHKKCSEFLHELLLTKEAALLTHYLELLSWMHILPPESFDEKSLLDRFHWHLQLAGRQIRESSLLHVAKGDKSEGHAPLDICIYLERLRSSHNVGSIIRTCEALRLGTILFSEGMCDATHPQVQKTAMGTIDWVPSRHEKLSDLKRPLIVLETVPTATAYYQFSFPDSFTLALGNEEYGCSDALLKRADSFIQIPLYGRKNSLNVAAAFAIVASEIVRQKRATVA